MNPTAVLIDQIRSGTAPLNIRQFAAQGLLPIPEDDLIPLQILLRQDPEEGVAKAAKLTLARVSEETWIRLVEKKDPSRDVLYYCLQQTNFPPLIHERILLNHSVPDEIVRHMASQESGANLDLIINNQVRLLRSNAILIAMEQNPFLTIDQKRRIEEFKTEFVFKKQMARHESPLDEVISLPLEDILARIPTLDAESQRLILEADSSKQTVEITDQQVQQELQKIFSPEELRDVPEEVFTTYQRIIKMNQGEKLRAALFGTKEERGILIRDHSKQVASMVLKNPKITDPELENFAQMRNLDSDILRQMGQSRDCVKKYTVIHLLVKNPKTPSPVSLNLLKLLREMDLRNIVRDRNIPDLIRRQAKRLYDMKEQTRK
ncbi:hypothetical protein L0222_17025 [bacterium]|nr:hypothetical protein [bacterium]